jgi:hypothetical protein
MKTKFLKLLVLKSKQRCAVALLSFVCSISFAVIPGAAQSPKQKRITALQLGTAAEGSRVSIVSDSALNDYEAFRRGDRFYVKAPFAEFTSALPHLRADGFEGVLVQKFGDSVVVSFRLQPGATARVDQRSNRLDVIFSAPNKILRNNAANAAGETPPESIPSFRDGVVTEGSSAKRGSRAPQNPRLRGSPSDANKAVTSLPAPVASPSSTLASSTSTSYPALTTATQAAPVISKPAANSSGFPDSKTRSNAVLHWVSANRLSALIGAFILLILILYLAMTLRRRQRMFKRSVRT